MSWVGLGGVFVSPSVIDFVSELVPIGEAGVVTAYLWFPIALALAWAGLAMVRLRYSWAIALGGSAVGIGLYTLLWTEQISRFWLLFITIPVGFALVALATAPEVNRRTRLISAVISVGLISAVIPTLV